MLERRFKELAEKINAGNQKSESDRPDALLTALMAEYNAIKEEQGTRIVLRDSALHVNLLISLSVLGVFFTSDSPNSSAILPLAVVTSIILFWVYFSNDTYVNSIRSYIDIVLRPNMDRPNASFQWEHFHRNRTFGRFFRKLVSFFIMQLSFVVPPLIGIALFHFSQNSFSGWSTTIALAAPLVVVFLASVRLSL